MLLAVEGGGFFSSSASGYSKGLALLLLGRTNEERPMRVSPWNHYQLVEQEGHSDLQLASRKKKVPCGCASFICFRCSSAGADGPSPPKVGPVHQSETLSDSSCASERGDICTDDTANVSGRKKCLKSSLKKQPTDCSVIVGEGNHAHDPLEAQINISGCTEKKKVQWTDACEGELVEIREFEQSDAGTSDDESERDGGRCECVIQ